MQVAALQATSVSLHQLRQHVGASGQNNQSDGQSDEQSHERFTPLRVGLFEFHCRQQRSGSLLRLLPALRMAVALSCHVKRKGLQF
jgi:hypothetical protein